MRLFILMVQKRLRALDEQGATTIFAQGFAETGLGTAYMNRLKKSANQKFFEK